MILAGLVALALASPPEHWTTDAAGRRMRIGFDPGSRLYLGGAVDDDARVQLEAGLLVRARADDETRRWKLDHGFLVGRFTPDDLSFALTLYDGRYLRWAKDGALVIPTIPPSRLAVPFDLGFTLRLFDLRREPARSSWSLDPIQAGLVFDFWRTRRQGSYLALEALADYDVEVPSQGPARHALAPFSHGVLHLHHEWCLGHQLLDVAVHARTRWTTTGWEDDFGARAAYELVLFAVNDGPVSLVGDAGWRRRFGRDELSVSVGLRLAWPTD